MSLRASILIPAHNKPTTLPMTVDTVLRQSMGDLEVIVIGDGVTDEVRDVVGTLTRSDERVRFLDLPKGPHHGERYRHDAIMAARSDAIFYLCDDDLLLPEHVSDLVTLLEEHDLVQSRNGYVTPAGEIRFYADDLSDPESVALHLRDDLRYNSISITGTAHSKSFYEKVGDPWDTTPEGWEPDHHQFRKLLREGSCRAATSDRMTALQFPTSAGGRHTWTPEEREAELQPWYELVVSPGAQDIVDRLGAEGARRQLVHQRHQNALLRHRVVLGRQRRERDVTALRGKVATLHEQLTNTRRRLRRQRRRADRLRMLLAEERARDERRWSRRLRRQLGRVRRLVSRPRRRRAGS